MRIERYDHNNDPKHPDSWVATYDEDGNWISHIHGETPKDPNSWTATYDERGNKTSKIRRQDPYCTMNEYTINTLIIGLQK